MERVKLTVPLARAKLTIAPQRAKLAPTMGPQELEIGAWSIYTMEGRWKMPYAWYATRFDRFDHIQERYGFHSKDEAIAFVKARVPQPRPMR